MALPSNSAANTACTSGRALSQAASPLPFSPFSRRWFNCSWTALGRRPILPLWVRFIISTVGFSRIYPDLNQAGSQFLHPRPVWKLVLCAHGSPGIYQIAHLTDRQIRERRLWPWDCLSRALETLPWPL